MGRDTEINETEADLSGGGHPHQQFILKYKCECGNNEQSANNWSGGALQLSSSIWAQQIILNMVWFCAVLGAHSYHNYRDKTNRLVRQTAQR